MPETWEAINEGLSDGGEGVVSVPLDPLPAETEEQAQVEEPASVSFLDQRLDDLSVTDSLLLLIVILLFLQMVLGLFTRKWGAYKW